MSRGREKLSVRLRSYLWLVLVAAALVLIVLSIFANRGPAFSEMTARKFSFRVERRIQKLNDFMDRVALLGKGEWPGFKDFPSDMVLYGYEDDSLRFWCNQFTLDNDDISRRVYVQRFSDSRLSLVSPLLDIDTTVCYVNFGPKWYLVKKRMLPKGIVLYGGLEIINTMDAASDNGVNPHFRLSDRFALYPVSCSGGITIRVEGEAVLKLLQEDLGVSTLLPDPYAIWIAIFLIALAVVLYLSDRRNIRAMWLSITGISLVMVAFFILGRWIQGTELFSPSMYAQGQFFYSLAAMLMVTLWIVLIVICVYISRQSITELLEKKNPRLRKALFSAGVMTATVGICLYAHFTLKGIIFNSNVTLELFKVNELIWHTGYVYISYIALFTAIALLLSMLAPAIRHFTGLRTDVFSGKGRVLLSVLGALYLILATTAFGLKKEGSRVEIWANRLAVDRNPGFEIRLRRVERAIAADPVVAAIIPLDGYGRVVINRVSENYLNRLSQDYDVTIYLYNDSEPVTEPLRFFSARLQNGVAIADSSRFVYSRTPNGRAQYTGLFTYYSVEKGISRMFIGMDSRLDKEGTGYSSILGTSSASGGVAIPQRYSYAKYISGNLVSYRGDYPYPTVLSDRLKQLGDESGSGVTKIDRYTHFLRKISEDEIIVISRANIPAARHLAAALPIMIALYASLTLASPIRRRKGGREGNYYKSRINTLLYLSLLAILVIMSAISVVFVYKRNEKNMMDLMTGKINTIQSLMDAGTQYFMSAEDFATMEFGEVLENIGAYTKSDISIYGTDGKALMSTSPEIFQRMMLGSRLNEDAYKNIMTDNARYFIHREWFSGHGYYAMYAPIINGSGQKLGVICTPYTESGVEFKAEAWFHALSIITVFLILVMIMRMFSTRMIEKMFKPLSDMAMKLDTARTEGMEYIIYDREDEISSLVRSYNLMVHDVSESSKLASQMERDKAWSEMARQVAHEIKNPLTPISLQIQRIVRLKRTDPNWAEKFDSIVPVIMDSINTLIDTANEFSTFARLYSEEPVLINLDEMASMELALFDDKENVSFQYIGLRDSWVMGPKPQITRVFVNLLTNAVQAIEAQQREDRDSGNEVVPGIVVLSIRNSSKDGFFDIVVEDNGPGVKDENRGNLFTPNFTTKSGGTGLGLAICKNVIERCGGEIQYSRSFSLKGACFTFRLLKASSPEK